MKDLTKRHIASLRPNSTSSQSRLHDFVVLCNEETELPGGVGSPPASALDTLDSDDMVKCAACGELFNYDEQPEVSMGAVACPKCGATVNQEGTQLANERLVDSIMLECAFANEVSEDKDGFVQLAPFGDKENITPDGLKVIQRFTPKDAEVLKNEFDQTAAEEAEAFTGVPIYRGHPDRDGTIPRGKAGRKIGRTMKLDIRPDGLYGTRLMNSRGSGMVKSGTARYPSVNWFAKPTGTENGSLIMQPFQLISWGLTPKPNLPVRALSNSAVLSAIAAKVLPNGGFNEDEHPRSEDGKFAPKEGGPTHTAYREDMKRIREDDHGLDADVHSKLTSEGGHSVGTRGSTEHRSFVKKIGAVGFKHSGNYMERGQSWANYDKGNHRIQIKHASYMDPQAKTRSSTAHYIKLPPLSNEFDAPVMEVVMHNSVVETGGTPATTPNQEGAKMDKAKLLALLASVGVTLANDATEEAIENAMKDTFGKVKAADEISVALANEKTAVKTATDKVTELTTALANEQTAKNEVTAKVATLEGEKQTLTEKLSVAETTLANARDERAKTAGEASKLATDLTEVRTKLGLTETTLANERAEKSKVSTALTNAKKAIVDLAVSFGKITSANRPKLEAALANDVEFAGICDQLKNADPVFKMAPILSNAKQMNADGVAPAEQYRALVNETMETKKVSRTKATNMVNASERGKALLSLMKQPETGIPVIRK